MTSNRMRVTLATVLAAVTLAFPSMAEGQSSYGMLGLGAGTFECTDNSCESFTGVAGYGSFGGYATEVFTWGVDLAGAYKSEDGVSLYTLFAGPSVGAQLSLVNLRVAAGLGSSTVTVGGESQTGYTWGANAQVGVGIPLGEGFLTPYAAYSLVGSDRAFYQYGIGYGWVAR